MPVHNYNGDGEWTVDNVVLRYEAYCQQFRRPIQRVLRAETHTQGQSRWVYPIMTAVIEGIKEDDPACTELGIDFICESKGFPFGMTLKSKTARALHKATLTKEQLDRIRHRVAQMLMEGYLPQEYRFYSRLFRRTGLGQYKDTLLAITPRGHRMTRYVNYVRTLLASEPLAPVHEPH